MEVLQKFENTRRKMVQMIILAPSANLLKTLVTVCAMEGEQSAFVGQNFTLTKVMKDWG